MAKLTTDEGCTDVSLVAVELERVPETLLWTLYHRAVEARRPDAVLRDPMAVELVDLIDFPFRERFGAGEGFSPVAGVAGAFVSTRRSGSSSPRIPRGR